MSKLPILSTFPCTSIDESIYNKIKTYHLPLQALFRVFDDFQVVIQIRQSSSTRYFCSSVIRYNFHLVACFHGSTVTPRIQKRPKISLFRKICRCNWTWPSMDCILTHGSSFASVDGVRNPQKSQHRKIGYVLINGWTYNL